MEIKYVDIIINTDEFIRLKELKKIIDEKYSKEIVVFKRCEANYLEANEHKEYYSNYEDIIKKFSDAKSNLYNKEEVKEYLRKKYEIPDYQAEVCVAFAQGNVGKAIQLATSSDFNELKMSISSKLGTNKILKI